MSTMETTSRVPSADELVARAVEIGPILARNAPEAERARRLSDETIDALADAGLLKITVPRRFGGYEVPIWTKMRVSAALGRFDGAAAWVATLINVCHWAGGLLGDQAQRDIWGENPDARIAGVLTPAVDVERVEGGYVVSGTWPYASGCLHADWALVGFLVPDGQGGVADDALAFVPMSDLSIQDTWHVAGMRATGSNTMVGERVFIPEHRTMSLRAGLRNEYPTPHKDEVIYRASLVPVLTLVLGGPQLGMGQAALDLVVSKAGKRGITYTRFERQDASVGFQIDVANAATLIDSAWLHMQRGAADVEAAAEAGVALDAVTRARVKQDTAYGITCVRRAIDLLLSAHGAGSFAEVSAMQRIWRDSATAGRHAVVDPAVNVETYGKALLGVDDHITALL